MITNEQINQARQNFEMASKEFGFAFHSPFVLDDDLTAFAYIENYGSKNGAVIGLMSPPDLSIDHRLVEWCNKMDCFSSFLNIELLIGEYSRAYFREMLRDWGHFE